jgi:heat shock protein HslJ
MDRKIVLNRLIVQLLAAAGVFATAVVQAHGEHVAMAPPSWQELANASYPGVLEEPVRLSDGEWAGEPFDEGAASAPRVGLVEDFLLSGDLDGDGNEESVVLLWSSSGGSGTFDYIAVMGRADDGSVQHRATAPLGDRVRLRSARIVDGRTILEVVQAGPGDAACCPGQKLRRTFVLEEGQLKEVSSEDLGRLSISDLEGHWRLTHFSLDEKVGEDIEITLHAEAGQISGRAACNRYGGSLREGESPGAIAGIGPLAVTRMMCPPPQMEAEQRFLAALEQLTAFSFIAGRLVLSWQGDEEGGALFFSRYDPPGSE